MADALRICEWLPGTRHAVILGGGLICLLTVHALLKLGLSVTIAVSSGRLLTRMLDEEAAALLQHRLAEAGVRILTRTDATRVVGRDGRVRFVVTAAGEALPVDLVILAKGIRPDIDLARAGGLATGRGVWSMSTCARVGRTSSRRAIAPRAPTCSCPGRRRSPGRGSKRWPRARLLGPTCWICPVPAPAPFR
jgi:NAD(P)H-nitrite reductase large subunit